jgi:transposase
MILNTKLDELRRDHYRDERELNNKLDVMKGIRRLLLRNNNSLTEKAKYRFEETLEINEPMAAAYYLKEELKLLWMQGL